MSYKDRGSKVRRSDDRVAALDRLAQYLEDNKGWNSESARLRSVAQNVAALNASDRDDAPVIMTGQRLDFNSIGQANDPRLNQILMDMRSGKVKEAHSAIEDRLTKTSEVEDQEETVKPVRNVDSTIRAKKEASADFKTRMLKKAEDMGLYD
jgi:hypothetical protein